MGQPQPRYIRCEPAGRDGQQRRSARRAALRTARGPRNPRRSSVLRRVSDVLGPHRLLGRASGPARREMTFAMSLPDGQEDNPVRYVLATHSPVLRAILLRYLGEDPGEPEHLEPIDLTLSRGEAPELCFRDRRRVLYGTAAGEREPR